MPQETSVYGQVRDHEVGTPIRMIRVTIYRDDDMRSRELTHAYTNDEGKYSISVPAGAPITVRFDTHYSLTNAREWHPSVVANVDAKQDVLINRFLLKVGSASSDMVSADILAAYLFCLVWNRADLDHQYSESASARLGMVKVPQELMELYQKLVDHFRKNAFPDG